MLTKQKANEIAQEIWTKVDSISEDHAMDCQISKEFTPGPDYATPIYEILKKHGITLHQLQEQLSPEESYTLYCLTF
jgi:hypothetical protein